jgi:dienelactone hydrolase
MPVVTFAEGGCQTDGAAFLSLLTEWASHGIMVIADGPPGNKGGKQSDKTWTEEALRFITKNGGQGKYANIDASRIGASGQSCGGMVAYNFAKDPRVSTLFIFNSGGFPGRMQGATADSVKTFTKPIGYALGGPEDIAYQNVCFWKLCFLTTN